MTISPSDGDDRTELPSAVDATLLEAVGKVVAEEVDEDEEGAEDSAFSSDAAMTTSSGAATADEGIPLFSGDLSFFSREAVVPIALLAIFNW